MSLKKTKQFDYKACIQTNTPTKTINITTKDYQDLNFSEFQYWLKNQDYNEDLNNATPITYSTPDELSDKTTGYIITKALWLLNKKVINLTTLELVDLVNGKSEILESLKHLYAYEFVIISDFVNDSLLRSEILKPSKGDSYAIAELLMNYIFNKGVLLLGTKNLELIKTVYPEGFYLYLKKYRRILTITKAVS